MCPKKSIVEIGTLRLEKATFVYNPVRLTDFKM